MMLLAVSLAWILAAESQTASRVPAQDGQSATICGAVTSYSTSPRCDVYLTVEEPPPASRRLQVFVPTAARPDFVIRVWQLSGAQICASGTLRVFPERTFLNIRTAGDLELIKEAPGAAFAQHARLSCGVGMTAPQVVSEKRPDYSPETLRARVEGVVEMQAVVETTGRVRDVRVQKSLHPQLDAAAMDALKEWRFKPGTLDGVPVPILVLIEMTFTVRKAP
jgi:TonB family protein